MINVGDFVQYGGRLAAVVNEAEKRGASGSVRILLLFYNDDHSWYEIDADILEQMSDFKLVKQGGCKSIVHAIYDDMTNGRF